MKVKIKRAVIGGKNLATVDGKSTHVVRPGDIAEVSQKQAERWINTGVAQPMRTTKKKVSRPAMPANPVTPESEVE